MDNHNSVLAVAESKFSKGFTKPLFDSYCFSRIPATLLQLFSGNISSQALPTDVVGDFCGEYDRVVCLFVDAFGWNFLERYTTEPLVHPVLQKLREQGVASKLTSQFPSTTANHVFTINTGLPITAGGVVEWNYFDVRVGRVINAVKFSFGDDIEKETLRGAGWSPESLIPSGNLYAELQKLGVSSHLFLSEDFVDSSYNKQVNLGAHKHGWKNAAQGLSQMAALLLSARDKTYAHYYYGGVDSAAHNYGANSQQVNQEVFSFFDLLEKHFLAVVRKRLGRALLILIADHGTISVEKDKIFYVDREVPEILSYLRLGSDGKIVEPAGSPPDFFLYVKQGKEDVVKELVQDRLGDRGEVWKVKDLLREGVFGSEIPTQEFLANIGDLIILGYPGVAICWSDCLEHRRNCHYSMHGGMNPAEMEIPFLAVPL